MFMQHMREKTGFFLGPILFFLVLFMPLPEGMKPEALKVAAVTVLMAVWWITEAIPLPATSLLPIALFPLLGIMKSAAATAPYANHLIYLFMGGFFIAVTMEKWNLHKRIAMHIVNLVGTSPGRLVLGFMIATAFLSMWVSNTATAMMMVPIGLAVIKKASESARADIKAGVPISNHFGIALMLGIAYSASIGGVATIIGTPPNVVMVGMMDKMYGQTISFFDWMLFGVPLAVIMIAIAWFLLTKVLFTLKGNVLEGGKEYIHGELAKLGKTSPEEKKILIIGAFVCTFWICRGFINIPALKYVHDATIGILGAGLLFITPTNFAKREFLLDWATAVKIPWDIILLFGGGLALANGFSTSGLAVWLATQLTGLQGVNMVVFIGIVVLMVIFLTEITSNTATATLLVPIMGSAAVALSIHPFGPIIAGCVSASFAFMLPVATPPNAVVFGSGCLTIPQMAKAGLWLNIIGTVVITAAIIYGVPLIWGVDLSQMPAWATVGQ
jgi:sodium-dependent dicarboxylate transporter 2/3/5